MEWELFGFEFSVLESVSSRRNISDLRFDNGNERYRDTTGGLVASELFAVRNIVDTTV